MGEQRTISTGRARIAALLTVALVVAFVATGVAASPQPLPVQGAVAAWAEGHPGEPVPLIVQHDGTPDGLLAFVRESAGSVEREFHIVPAIDVDMPADLVDDLARQDDVNWISLDAPVVSTGGGDAVDTRNLATAYPYAVSAPAVWNASSSYTGRGVTVAVVDTGITNNNKDFKDGKKSRVLHELAVSPAATTSDDGFGHGNHVAGIIGSDGDLLRQGEYVGIAPSVDFVDVKISDESGSATMGDVMAGLEWVDDNRQEYNIGIVNLSLSSSVAQSYTVDPLDAAVELLWFHDIVVVVAAGNEGMAADAVHYPPANDPFVITVGAFDDQGTVELLDDRLTDWSSRGTTQDGFAKPEVVAPGSNIISDTDPASVLATEYPDYVVDNKYLRMSGTSMSTAVVSGLVALVLEAHPEWTPGEMKHVLVETTRPLNGSPARGVLADAAVAYSGAPDSADDGLTPSYLLLAALVADDLDLEDPTVLDGIRWRDANFEGVRWRGLEFEGIRWRDVDWSGIRWRNVEFSGIRWRDLDFQGIRWRGIRWRAFVED